MKAYSKAKEEKDGKRVVEILICLREFLKEHIADKLFQILTLFFEKDMFSLSNLEYSRKKLPLVDDLVLCERILCW